eukprot:gnl/MRDRNA2_/MRDRNA2_105938_c0_seq1.p1 gnl/MRDRNA2_/MRDRNA2_105938_c0~~gnl/MRDRNA2_/MRDRNA2_105938_c0_seq1.p1  ORF type:complete len:493 (+),score=88.22 gnl/MRDRNA2_/MRDRNA2_105938_c0_seq1:95-1573(+)
MECVPASVGGSSQAHVNADVFRRGLEEMEEILAKVPSNAREVAALLGRLHDGADGSQFTPCVTCALAALEMGGSVDQDFARMMLEDGVRDESELSKFRREVGDIAGLFTDIKRWALDAMRNTGSGSFPQTVQVWAPGSGSQRVEYTAAQCRGLLANALLMNVRDTSEKFKTMNKGGLNLNELIQSTRHVAAGRLACLLQYFDASRYLEQTEDNERKVIFERRSAPPDEQGDMSTFHQWALQEGQGKNCDANQFMLHDAGMEAVEDAEAFVNFANAHFGYGCFIPSCTQEEIMQSCCPEFNAGMLHLGVMLDNEVVAVHGVRRFSRYTGYGHTFEYQGPWLGLPCIQSILTMDAATSEHFTQRMVLRDIRKAYLAFQSTPQHSVKVISTGRWGCGAFGGTPSHKVAQQMVAASLAGCGACFSTFGSLDQCDVVLAAVAELKPTVATLLEAILLSSAAVLSRTEKDFASSLQQMLKKLQTVAAIPAAPADVEDV